jgi:hypothetical protein
MASISKISSGLLESRRGEKTTFQDRLNPYWLCGLNPFRQFFLYLCQPHIVQPPDFSQENIGVHDGKPPKENNLTFRNEKRGRCSLDSVVMSVSILLIAIAISGCPNPRLASDRSHKQPE